MYTLHIAFFFLYYGKIWGPDYIGHKINLGRKEKSLIDTKIKDILMVLYFSSIKNPSLRLKNVIVYCIMDY